MEEMDEMEEMDQMEPDDMAVDVDGQNQTKEMDSERSYRNNN